VTKQVRQLEFEQGNAPQNFFKSKKKPPAKGANSFLVPKMGIIIPKMGI